MNGGTEADAIHKCYKDEAEMNGGQPNALEITRSNETISCAVGALFSNKLSNVRVS